jgi:acetylornithine deacetylase/succinyl-diaminopimelate desuccinylase-like protein
MMKPRYISLAFLAAGLVVAVSASAAATKPAQGGNGATANGPPVSPEVRRMLHEVSADRIEQTIEKLVSFGTRHTLSSQTDPNRGIGAATKWVVDQLQQAATASDGRMTVEQQSFVQPPGPRNPNAVTVTNVIATLRGAQPESANRIYVVSGHLDTRCTNFLDFECDAPGANDDGSGVAAVLELARVMATHTFEATIKFVTFAGEEQGLFGSAFVANQAKQQG